MSNYFVFTQRETRDRTLFTNNKKFGWNSVVSILEIEPWSLTAIYELISFEKIPFRTK